MDELLARIRAEPEDLAARMVYGDALVEAGDPRGELVVAQGTLAQAGVDRVEDLIDVDGDLAHLAAIQRRVQQLEAQFGKLWAAPLELPENASVDFRRGMPEAITIGEGVDAAPLVERLAKLTPISELTLRRKCTAGGLEKLAVWSGLRVLDVTSAVLPWEALERIIAKSALHTLRLTWTKTDKRIDQLAKLPALKTLRRLELNGHRELEISAIIDLLAAHPDLAITLRSNQLTDDDVLKLVDARPQLRGLDVCDNPLNVSTLRALVALPRLRYLGFDPERAVKHDKGTVGRTIAKATAPLRSLALGGSVNGAGLAAIAASRLGVEVRAIDLANDRPGDIGKAGNKALAQMRSLVMLRVRGESAEVGLAKLPALAYFDCGYVHKRDMQKRLVAQYGSSVPAYEESDPTHARGAVERRIQVPDKPGIDMQGIARVLESINGLVVERNIHLVVRDPKVTADPIGITLKKLPNKPRYITLWHFRDDAGAWAKRLDQIAGALAKACKGRDLG